MTITKSKEMTADEKQIDSIEQTSTRKPDGELYFLYISSFRFSVSILWIKPQFFKASRVNN